MAGLLSMARTFSKESEAVTAADNSGPQNTPDGGNTTVTSALAGALQAAELTTRQFSEVVASHGTKLNGAYQQYHDAEESNAQLCEQLTRLAEK